MPKGRCIYEKFRGERNSSEGNFDSVFLDESQKVVELDTGGVRHWEMR